jgi:hypothetical protein
MTRYQRAVVGSILLAFLNTPSAEAAGNAPKLTVTCGQIVGKLGDLGTYGLFSPDISVKYYGSPLVVTAYLLPTPSTKKSEAGKQIVTFTQRAPSTKYFNSIVDLDAKILDVGQKQTGYFKIIIEAVDTLKRKGTFTCVYKDYYFETPSQSSSTSGLGLGSSSYRGFNKTNCTFNGKRLYGRVYFTKYSFEADFAVYLTNYSFDSDLKVYLTDYSFEANSCGLWHRTNYSFEADITVYVSNYSFDSDFKIYETDFSFEAGK